MKILLVLPASGKWHGLAKRRLFSGKTFRFSLLSLLSVAALTPRKHSVRIVDEQIEAVPADEHFDLVGISVMTATAPRAYELCARFTASGAKVVLGGVHPTLNTAEALVHADAVVAGTAYGAWQRLLIDLEEGALKEIYRGDPDHGIPVHLPRELMKKRNYVTANATFATIGCRNSCKFCTVGRLSGGRRHRRRIDDVVSEIAAFAGSRFMMVDDNLTQDRDYAVDLLKRLAPLRKTWATQASIDVADDPELLHLLQKAGCMGLFIGLESFNDESLASARKPFKPAGHYREAVKTLHRHGIVVVAGIIFGFDTDDRTVFRRTLRALERAKVDMIQVSVLTPLPGTSLFAEMRDRIWNTNWEDYTFGRVVFDPQQMTAAELEAGANWVKRKFYSPWRILKRLPRWLAMPRGWRNFRYPLALNLAYLGRNVVFGHRGGDPDRRAQWSRRRGSLLGATLKPSGETSPPGS